MSFKHHWIPNSARKIQAEMLHQLGIESVDELFKDVPSSIRLKDSLNLPPALSEQEVFREIKHILNKNLTSDDVSMFLGSGVWPHHVPSVVSEIVNRSEFLTSYTPYQSEVSQGMLQALWEYQSLVCELTGMEVANASIYDWSTSIGEVALMAARLTNRRKFIIPRAIHPDRLSTLLNYISGARVTVQPAPYDLERGTLDLQTLSQLITNDTAGVYVEQPNFFGVIETHVEKIAKLAHEKDALFIIGADPTSLGILEAPGTYGADMVVGEGQPLGNHMNFGGPLLGVYACKYDAKMVRAMPGRITGLTTIKEGEDRAFCSTLQTREQHIRREKATSNICSNEALWAVAAAVYLSLLGPEGLKRLGEICMSKAYYAMKKINKVEGLKSPIFDAPHFKEFTVRCESSTIMMTDIKRELLKHNIHGGKIISGLYPELGDTAVYCVTETHSKDEIDRLAETVSQIIKGG